MLLSTAIRRWSRRMPAIVFGVDLNRILPLISKSAHVGHRVRVVPAFASPDPSQAIRGPGGSLAQHDRIVDERDVQPIAGRDPKASSCLAWDHDLMLGADLHA